MTFATLFGFRARVAPRTECPFCPGPASRGPHCNLCAPHVGRVKP